MRAQNACAAAAAGAAGVYILFFQIEYHHSAVIMLALQLYPVFLLH